ncbi:hypothetical protein L9F63_027252, partial [Diploptera punctata]
FIVHHRKTSSNKTQVMRDGKPTNLHQNKGKLMNFEISANSYLIQSTEDETIMVYLEDLYEERTFGIKHLK